MTNLSRSLLAYHGRHLDTGVQCDEGIFLNDRILQHLWYIRPHRMPSKQALTNDTGFFYMIMTVLTLLYVLASLRTNIVLVITFFFIDMAFFMLMSSYWVAAEGKTMISHDLQIVSKQPTSALYRLIRLHH